MYYSFYLNEKMALDNWEHYDDVNWLLLRLLGKDKRKNTDEALAFYFEHRHVREGNEWGYDILENDEWFQNKLAEYKREKMYYEMYIEDCKEEYMEEHPDEFDEDVDIEDVYIDFNDLHSSSMAYNDFSYNSFYENFEQHVYKKDEYRRRSLSKHVGNLREIDEVILYKSDFDVIKNAKMEHNLNQKQVQLLFGFIFFSRMNDVPFCRVGTNYKWKSFKACFDKTITNNDLQAIRRTKLFENEPCENDTYRRGWKYQNKKDDWVYKNFDDKDEVAYVFRTTLENNKLNLSKLAKEIVPDYGVKYCVICGEQFTLKSNSQIYCSNCKEDSYRYDAMMRKRRQREREKLKVTK